MKIISKFISLCLTLLLLFTNVSVIAHEGHKKAQKDTTVVQLKDSVPHGHVEHTAPALAETTALEAFPNLHPLVVHFPIVLLIVAALMQLVGLFLVNRTYHIAIAIISVAGFIGAYLASNTFHAHPGELTGAVADLFEEHEYWAFWSVRLIGIGVLIKAINIFTKPKRWLEAVIALFMLGSAVCVSISGHHGAELVHKYGIGAKGYMLEKHHH